MQSYSDYFKTLHDEQNPTGYLGRGTHCSILRAVVFHDAMGNNLSAAQFADFAVIWDEDHDERVIEPIEKLYRYGMLSSFLMFGERKAIFTAIVQNDLLGEARVFQLRQRLNTIVQDLDDPWNAELVSLRQPDNPIISDTADRVSLYLNNLAMLWALGLKSP